MALHMVGYEDTQGTYGVGNTFPHCTLCFLPVDTHAGACTQEQTR